MTDRHSFVVLMRREYASDWDASEDPMRFLCFGVYELEMAATKENTIASLQFQDRRQLCNADNCEPRLMFGNVELGSTPRPSLGRNDITDSDMMNDRATPAAAGAFLASRRDTVAIYWHTIQKYPLSMCAY
ncbi:hypothetical protein EVAR_19718_1 [Eumeta japonica]|uniref:Uncharacterized protein n=1 Tax=Eumeta variegata TaxID=151549 RepID=A0A4C1URN4_EUMVA|nr:hypothetical protein EVAR_19718_1 [Eumeta japonica]